MKVSNFCSDDYANFAFENSAALKSVGIECDCYTINKHPFDYPKQGKQITREAIKKKMQLSDVVQIFHSDTAMLNIYKKTDMRAKLIVYHTGTPYRVAKDKMNKAFNPYLHKSVIALGEFADQGAHNEVYIVGAVDTNKIKFDKRQPTKPPIFGHFPSNPKVKGTEDIISATYEVPVFMFATERVDFERNLERMRACDIYIELLAAKNNGHKYGSFGISALEAAALGKIVVTQNLSAGIYEKNYGYCPFVLVHHKYDLRKKLIMLNELSAEEIRFRQMYTRDWVEKNHSYKATGERILNSVLK